MRKKGSCQFAAYYKVEYYDEKIVAWRPIQKALPTIQDALIFKKKSKFKKIRIMKISEKGVEVYSS